MNKKLSVRSGRCDRRHPLTLAIATVLLLGAADVSRAAVSQWTGASSDDWADASNWSTAPTSGSEVYIDAVSPHGTRASGVTSSIGLLQVGVLGQGGLRLDGGSRIDVTGASTISGMPLFGLLVAATPGSQGDVTVSGAGTVLNTANYTLVGYEGKGTLSVLDGATAKLGVDTRFVETMIGFGLYGTERDAAKDGVGTINVDGAGSTLIYGGGMNVLNGALNVTAGAQVSSVARDGEGSAFWFDIVGMGMPSDGADFGGLYGTAVATVSGAGSAWNSINGLDIGSGGTGTLQVIDGGTASFSGLLFVGDTGVLINDDGTQSTTTLAGTGALIVSGEGSTLTLGSTSRFAGNLTVGAGGQGTVTVNAGGLLQLSGLLDVGGKAEGSVDISSGGRVNVGGSDDNQLGATLGLQAGMLGAIHLSGSGSTLAIDAGAQVGYLGNGELSVTDGGTANIGLVTPFAETVVGFGYYGSVAGASTGTGAVNIAGSGSTVHYAGGFNLLNGTLDVSAGGQLLSQHRPGDGEASNYWLDMLGFGLPPGGTADGLELVGHGSATIQGSGARWASVNGLDMGRGGAGDLVILDGGYASFQGSLLMATLASVPDPDGNLVSQAGAATVHVSGAGSSLEVAASDTIGGPGLLLMGEGGNASLTIEQAGSVSVDRALVVGGSSQATVTVASGGTLSVDGGDPSGLAVTLGRDAGSQGQVAVTGSGSSLVTAPQAGVMVGAGGAGTLILADAGTVVAPGGITVGTHGTVVIGGAAPGGSLFAPGSVQSPTLTLADAGATLIFQHSADAYDFDTSIGGIGTIDARAGFTQLTADSGAFTGHTTVWDGATLSVNGTLGGDVMVDAGGRLQGTGTVGNAVIAGTLAPGNSPGTLNVAGDLTMQGSAVYEAQIDTVAGISDSVHVAGNVTIAPGAALKIENIGGGTLVPGTNIQLIQAAGTVAGQFDVVDDPDSPFLGYGLTYTGGTIVVNVTRSNISFASVGRNAGEAGVGAALDTLPGDSGLAGVVYGQLTSQAQAAVTLGQMQGLAAADTRRVMLRDTQLPRDAIQRRLQEAAALPANGVVWAQAMGHWGSTDADRGVPKAQADGSGLMLGTDAGVGAATRLGAAAGFGQTSYRMSAQGASAHIKSTHVTMYGRTGMGALGLIYGAAYSWSKVDNQRAFDIGAIHQQLHGDHRAHAGQVFVDAGYRLGNDSRRYLEPFVALAHASVSDQGWRETGGDAAIATHSGDTASTFGTMGLRWAVAEGASQWYGTLGWRHVFGSLRATATQSFVEGGSDFEVQSLPLARDAAVIELGAGFAVASHARVTAAYSGLMGDGARDHGVNLRLTVDF